MSDSSQWALALGIPSVLLGVVAYAYRRDIQAHAEAVKAHAELLADLRKDTASHAVRLTDVEARMLTFPMFKAELSEAKRDILAGIEGMKRQVDIDIHRAEETAKTAVQDVKDLRKELAAG